MTELHYFVTVKPFSVSVKSYEHKSPFHQTALGTVVACPVHAGGSRENIFPDRTGKKMSKTPERSTCTVLVIIVIQVMYFFFYIFIFHCHIFCINNFRQTSI